MAKSMNDLWKAMDIPDSQEIPSSGIPPSPVSSQLPTLTSSDMTMDQMMGTDAVKFKNTLPNDLRQEYETRLLECFTQPDPAACAEQLMHEFQKRIAPTETKECELLYIAMIQSFMHFINAFATNSGLENITIKHDNQKRYTYVVLPKFFNVLSFNNY
ncbi:uncharacterized protein TNCT_619301 [Trichonephila clavata]|uniref:Uncharacterized protein n=1 Tax=Trichonephila clavata TaxID=2740835 RepID=A0A8X6KSL0_TRICU|nr:uncharacterized protein TNCT_619301 [Trichonephila clavata]